MTIGPLVVTVGGGASSTCSAAGFTTGEGPLEALIAWAELLFLLLCGNLTAALIAEAQLLVSQQAENQIVAAFAAFGNFVGRFEHSIKPHRNVGQSFSCKQLPSVSSGLFILTVCPGCNSHNCRYTFQDVVVSLFLLRVNQLFLHILWGI